MAFNRGEVSTAVNVEVWVVSCMRAAVSPPLGGEFVWWLTSQVLIGEFSVIAHLILDAAFGKTYTRMMFALPIAAGEGTTSKL